MVDPLTKCFSGITGAGIPAVRTQVPFRERGRAGKREGLLSFSHGPSGAVSGYLTVFLGPGIFPYGGGWRKCAFAFLLSVSSDQQKDYLERCRPRFEGLRSCWKVPDFFLVQRNVKSKKGRLRRDGLFLKGGSPMRTRTPKYGTRIRCVTDYTIGLCNGHLCGAGELKRNRLFFASFFFTQMCVLNRKNECGEKRAFQLFSRGHSARVWK